MESDSEQSSVDCSDNNSNSSTSKNINKDKDDVINDKKPVDLTKFFTKKELFFYKMIDRYFKQCSESQIKTMRGIIDGESQISLRVLDWFVTRYSHKRKITFNEGDGDEYFNVHISYKAQLKSYKKKYFDPFRRTKKKFWYYYDKDKTNSVKSFYTTLGQLNFFRWALSNKIIDYVEKNLQAVNKAMNISNKEDKKKKLEKKDKSSIGTKSLDKKSLKGTKNTKRAKEEDEQIKVKAVKKEEDKEVKFFLSFD